MKRQSCLFTFPLFVASCLLISIQIITICPSTLWAEVTDTIQERQLAVAKYMALYPMKKVLEDTASQMTMQLPPEQREQYIRTILSSVRIEVIENAAAASLVKHLSLNEINSLIAFVEKPEGRSALDKMKFYTADLMPVLQQEFARSGQMGAGGGYYPPGGNVGGYYPPGAPGGPGGYPGGGYPPPAGSGGYPGGGYPPPGYSGQPGYPPPGYGSYGTQPYQNQRN